MRLHTPRKNLKATAPIVALLPPDTPFSALRESLAADAPGHRNNFVAESLAAQRALPLERFRIRGSCGPRPVLGPLAALR